MNTRPVSRRLAVGVFATCALPFISKGQLPVDNLSLWLDAQDAATIQTAGGTVFQWDDKSGSGNHAAQTDANRRPAPIGAINTFQAMRFDAATFGADPGSDGLNVNDTLNLARPYTAFIVDQYWDVSLGGGRTLQSRESSATHNWLLGSWGCCGVGTNVGHFAQGWVGADGGLDTPAFAAHASEAVGGLGDSYFTVDGKAVGRAGFNGQPGRLQIGFGGTGGFDEGGRTDVGEVIIYNRVLTDPERNQVNNYLAAKWNLPRPAQRHYAMQTSRFTGGDAGEGIDLEGNIIYAASVDTSGATIRGVTFTDVTATAGSTFAAENHIPLWLSPNYGATANDLALANATRSIRWSTSGDGGLDTVAGSVSNLVPGRSYKVQFLMEDMGPTRHSAFRIDGDIIRSDIAYSAMQGGAAGPNVTAGTVVTYQFTAAGPTMTYQLERPDTGATYDTNPIFNAMTVEDLGVLGVAASGAISGPSSLDLSGNFVYALDFANSASTLGAGDRVVNGLTFTPAELNAGAFIYAENFLAYQKPEFGIDPSADALEDILHTIRWEQTNQDTEAVAVDLLGLTIGAQYKLQLLIGDDPTNNRHFDIVIEDVQVADDFGANDTGSQFAFWSYEFTAQDSQLNILLNGWSSPNPDHNPILSGLTLEQTLVPEPGSAFLLLAGVSALGFKRRRRR
jgi:hypothetical protein